jgi:DNA-directed RNA polymerase specialized sigma24 family protein
VASPSAAACAAPADYADLFETYGPDIRNRIRARLPPSARPQDVEDGLQHVMGQFVKNDVIGQYDPTFVSEYTHKPVPFRAFVMAKVELYCRNLRDVLARQQREVLLVDAPVGDDEGTRWVDALGGDWDDYPSLRDGEVLGRLREALGRRPSPSGQPSLLAMFDALAGRFAAGQSVTAAGVRGQLQLDREGSIELLGQLREALREITDPARYELGGVLLSAEQVRAAVEALRSAPGNRVLPVFQDAGHPLAAAGKTWYLDFAADVLREHPECRTPKGGHYPGGHFGKVKAALIYGMELMAGREPAEAPASQAEGHMWAALESILARLPGSTPERVAVLMGMARLVFAEDLPEAA